MRNYYLCLLLIFSAVGFSQGEVSKKTDLEFGFRFGLTLSDLVTEQNTITPKATFLTGLHAEYHLNTKWSLQPELLFVRKGESSRSRNIDTGSREEDVLILNYIEVPFLVKYKLKNGLLLETGPYVSRIVTAKQKSITTSGIETISIHDSIEEFDAGLAVGAVYETEWNFFVGLRYTQGFINVFKNENTNNESYNTQLQLYFGYSL